MAILQRIVLRDFRNFPALDLEFAPGVNVFVGANGQGKTNLLEAIHFLSILRSFRASQLRHLFRWRQSSFLIRGELARADGRLSRVGLEFGQVRRLRVDEVTLSRASDFIGRLFTVAFAPEDIELVKGPASERRRFLDITLSQLYPAYLNLLQRYDKALRSRNLLLRRQAPDPAALRAFEQILLPAGAEIMHYRLRFFEDLTAFQARASEQLLPEKSLLTLRYNPTISPPAEQTVEALTLALQDALTSGLERDLARGMTHVGPHRDDFMLLLNGKNLTNFGSEGQCRLGAMVLKLAQAGYLMARRREEAVLLLVDDVIGELDDRGCRAFFQAIASADQVFVACTELGKLRGLQPSRLFQVVEGRVALAGSGEPAAGEAGEQITSQEGQTG